MASAFVEGILLDPHDQDCDRDVDRNMLIMKRIKGEDKKKERLDVCSS